MDTVSLCAVGKKVHYCQFVTSDFLQVCARTGRRGGLYWTLPLNYSHILRTKRWVSPSTHTCTHTRMCTHTHTHSRHISLLWKPITIYGTASNFFTLQAYTEADRGTPKGVIALNDMKKIWQNTKKKEHLVRHVFTVETKSRTYLFRAPSLITMELWMAVLNMPPSTLQVNAWLAYNYRGRIYHFSPFSMLLLLYYLSMFVV